MKNKSILSGYTLREINNLSLSALISIHIMEGIEYHISNGKITGYFIP